MTDEEWENLKDLCMNEPLWAAKEIDRLRVQNKALFTSLQEAQKELGRG